MTGAAETPTIWILWRRRKGDLDQMLALTGALGWPTVIKRLDFASPDVPWLAPMLLRKSSDDLSPPWPDIALCAEALPSVIARSLRRRSGGRVRAISLARPAGSPAHFDLVITTPQYRLPPAVNVLELSLPLGAPSDRAATRDVAGNRIAVAVGGSSFPDRLDQDTATTMAAALMWYAHARGMALDVATSPRTGPEATAALAATLTPPHILHPYTEGPQNAYRQLIADAREIVVTSDSVSMIADALQAGRPVSVYRLPQTRTLQWRAADWLHANAVRDRKPWLAPVSWAFDAGVLESTADRHLLIDRLVRDGRVSWFGEGPPPPPQPDWATRDMDRAVARVRALMRTG